MRLSILHLSDFHIGASDQESHNLQVIVKAISEYDWGAEPPVLLITGDLVNDGRKEQFFETRELLSPLYEKGFTLLPVPGNHDYGWRGNHAEKKRFNHFKSAFFHKENVCYPHVREIGSDTFIGLNSMKAEAGFFDGLLADGELGHRQLEDLNGILRKCDRRRPEEKVVLYLHHHPFLYPDESTLKTIFEKAGHWLKDGETLMEVIRGRVDILMFGHEHRHLDLSGTHLTESYRIPVILSCGKSTEFSRVNGVRMSGAEDPDRPIGKGLKGFLVTLEKSGELLSQTVFFSDEGLEICPAPVAGTG